MKGTKGPGYDDAAESIVNVTEENKKLRNELAKLKNDLSRKSGSMASLRLQLEKEKVKSSSVEEHLTFVLAESVADPKQKRHNNKKLVMITIYLLQQI